MKKLYGVGIGPGDHELITLKAYNLIRNCDYIFAPKSKGKSLAKEIVSEYTKDKEIIELDFPMGEDNEARYVHAAQKIENTLMDDEKAVFLTLGDSMVYSTYIYLMFELQKIGVITETVPGITSFTAAASCINTPITIRDESFYLCDKQLDEEVLKRVDSVCILKVNKQKEKIIELLEKNNFQYVYIKRCTQEDQTILYDKKEILKDQDYISLILARRNK